MTTPGSDQSALAPGDRMLVPPGGGVMSIATWHTANGSPAFATAGTDGTIRRWDALTGAQIGEPSVGHTGNVWAIAAGELADGRPMLASAGVDGTIRRWDAVSGEPAGAPVSSAARALTFWRTPDSRVALAGVSIDGEIGCWDAQSGLQMGNPLVGHQGSGRSIVVWTLPDGRPALASAGSDGTVRCWDPVAGTTIGAPLTGHDGRVRAVVAWTLPDGRPALASAGSDGTVRCWDPVAGTTIGAPLTGHDGTVQVLAVWFLPDGRAALASGGVDGTIRRWDPASGKAFGEPILAGTGAIWAVASCQTPGGSILISCGDSDVQRWDAITGAAIGQPMSGHTVELRALASWRAADGSHGLASGGDDLTVQRWDAVTGAPVGEPLTGHAGAIRAMTAWTGPDAQLFLAAAGDDGTIRRWDAVTGAPVGEPLTGHAGAIRAMTAWTGPDAQLFLAAAGDDGTIRRWDAVTGAPVGEPLTGHAGAIRAMTAWTGPDAQLFLAAAGDDGTIRRWDAVTGAPVGEPLTGHAGAIRAMTAWTGPDAQLFLAAAGDDGTIRRWDAVTGAPVGEPLTGHAGAIRAMTAWTTPGGRRALATGGDDLTVRQWDALGGDALGEPLTGHTGAILAMTGWVDDAGQPTLATGGGDGTIRIWDLTSGATISRIEVGAVRLRGLSDRAASVDLLDRGVLAAVIADQIFHPIRPADDAGPNVVTVEGPWGSGKTTLLEMIRTRLPLARPAPGRRSRLRVRDAFRALSQPAAAASPPGGARTPHAAVSVWFDPWMHQSGDQVWAGLTRSIIDAVNATLLADEGTRRRFWFTANVAKIDRPTVRRALFQNSVPTLLRIAIITTAAPVLVSLAQLNEKLSVGGDRVSAATIAFGVSLILVASGVVSWAWRYFVSDVTLYLPRELFEGPVVSGPLAEPGSVTLGAQGEALRDAFFRARSGALYLYQHDTREVLEYVRSQGYELIVFIDDLDRCTASTTAEVFEAVNLFLADPRLPGRFVMGFDPLVVAAHLNSAYADLDSTWLRQGDDPGPGWAFLRKLVQLPVLVPTIGDGGIRKFVDTVVRPGPAGPAVAGSQSAIPLGLAREQAASPRQSPDQPGGALRGTEHTQTGAEQGFRPLPTQVPVNAVPLEASPEVSALIEQRLSAQPDLTIREAKRLINVWQLYAHLLDLVDPPDNSQSAVDRGCHLVILAEIISRWPALLRGCGKAGHGMLLLAAARDDDSAWEAAKRELEVTGAEHLGATQGLRDLLRAYDGPAVARLAAQLL